ncbi:hypothetical protein TSAR_009653 [Trichomalopsis sarcophagae]|uniref:Uncharacterized protein n=1 Tax=Trichomalopsis sarcophagae TaxID=543379 RepID=A0A232ELA3_9HYME|nr:hypothetical protein TSAR_009653 [Trichomalopsis sarcophagae]
MGGGGVALDRVDVIKDLDVHFDSVLAFEPHIDRVTSKASRLLGFIKRTTSDFKHYGTIFYLYRSTLVLPILLYCSPIWSHFTK